MFRTMNIEKIQQYTSISVHGSTKTALGSEIFIMCQQMEELYDTSELKINMEKTLYIYICQLFKLDKRAMLFYMVWDNHIMFP